jgi:hypothetical protein
MEALDCPRALTVSIMIRNSEWEQLAKLEVDPAHHITSESYFVAAQASCFLKKHEDLTAAELDPEAAAIRNWKHAESECYFSNLRIYPYINGFAVNAGIETFLRKVRLKIATILRKCPEDELVIRFGPGATVSDPSRKTTIPDKMTSQPTSTTLGLGVLSNFARSAWGRAVSRRGDEITVVRGNSFFTVPKDATKHRSCAKEPSLNVAYQLALGHAIRRRLGRVGLDLDKGQKLHKRVACSSSIDDSFATIDLSSASDCISEGLVRALLPEDWFNALYRTRSPFTLFPKEGGGKAWIRLEKFSSMGNGFTFELETLIFAAICATVVESCLSRDAIFGTDVFVYGDDIIVPTECGPAVLSALKWCGFTPNGTKTYLTGSFRESCGGDFFLGADVRPFYWKKDLHEPHDRISLANGLRRSLIKVKDPLRRKALLRHWFSVLDSIPSHIRRCRGPEDLGDIVIHDEVRNWDTRTRDSIRSVRVWKPARYRKVFLSRFHSDVTLASFLYGVFLQGDSSNDELRFLVPRDGVIGYACGWVPFS